MDYIGNLFEVKNSYFVSILIVVIIIFTTVFIWHKIESFVEEEDEDVPIKTQQCDDCKLLGNSFNSYYEIYKRAFKNRRL